MASSFPPRIAALGALLILACGPSTQASNDTGSGGTSTGTSSAGNPTTAGMTTIGTSAGDSGTAGMDGAGTTTGSGLDTGMGSGGFINDGGTGDPPPPGGLGEMCSSNAGCQSGFCYQVPMLGGVCSECLMDSDCDMGTCAASVSAGYAVCTDGSAGVMCGSDAGCMDGLVCGQVLDTGGNFPADFCSECDANAPCPDGELCTPQYDAANFSGELVCAMPASVMDGGGCPITDGVGDGTVCTSGFCGIADVFGIVQLGVCGECVVDSDCPMMGQTCNGPTAGMGGIQPAVCQ